MFLIAIDFPETCVVVKILDYLDFIENLKIVLSVDKRKRNLCREIINQSLSISINYSFSDVALGFYDKDI